MADNAWSSGAEPNGRSFDLDGHGNFADLAFEPGRDLVLRCQLNLPAEIAGIPVVGEPLLLTIFSIYPMDLSWNGQAIFEDAGVPVAAGPALVQVIPSLRAGDNGELEAHVHVPDNQTTPWFHLRFTTPGLRARFELLDVAWAQLALAHDLAAGEPERAAVVAATACVPEQLVTSDAMALQAALRQMEIALAPLADRASALTFHIIGHSHIDMNWLWTWPDTVEVIRRDIKSVLALMHDYPEMTFTHSQPATYDVIRQREPTLFERIREHIQSGRWEPATLTWVEGDSNMASGEAHARQLLEGVRFSRQLLGARPSAFMAPDTFGHAGNVPQLAASAGASCYYHHRGNPGQADQWPAYWWEGQDGTVCWRSRPTPITATSWRATWRRRRSRPAGMATPPACTSIFALVAETAGAVTAGALAVLERGVQPGRVAITNPLGWDRADWVCVPDPLALGAVWLEDDHGQRTPGQQTADGLGFVARVPAFATASYAICADAPASPPDLVAEPCFAPTDAREVNLLADVADEPPYYKIETPDFRVYLRRDSGILVAFLDKRVNRELIGYGMRRGSDYLDTARADLAFNVLQLLDERPHGMSAWHLDEVQSKHSLLHGATTCVVESGAARLVIETQRDVRGSQIVQRAIFYRDLARVDFQVDVDWRERTSNS